MKIFVIGTARSGTNWMGRILDSHPDVRATIEARHIFPLVTKAAIAPSRRFYLLPLIKTLYRFEAVRSRPQHHADKSHPAIWIAEELAEAFPDARFVGMSRNPYATVASMLRKEGVRYRQEDWRNYELPSPFLGIGDGVTPEAYAEMSAASRAALRWQSHEVELARLARFLPESVKIVQYGSLVSTFEEQLGVLWDFLGLSPVSSPHAPSFSSLDAWRDQLSEEQVADVQAATGVRPDAMT